MFHEPVRAATDDEAQKILERMRHEVLQIENIVAWLRLQPRWREYHWDSPYDCLIGRYLRAKGFTDPKEYVLSESDLARHQLLFITNQKPWTYGWALQRAEDWMAFKRAAQKGVTL